MGKLVKGLLSVVAVVAPFIPGIGWVAAAAIAVGASVGASLLSKKAPPPAVSPSGICRMRAHLE